MKIINETITNLGHQEDQKLQYLSSTGALDDYTKLNQMLTDKEKELYALMQYQNMVKQNQLAVEENRKEYIEDDIATGQYLEEFTEQKKYNIILFKSFVEKLRIRNA